MPHSKFYEYWNYLTLMLCLLWVVTLVPYRLSFEDKREIELWVCVIDTLVDIIFFINSLMNFVTPLEFDSTYIFERKKVAIIYLRSFFIFDMFACNPVALFKYTSKFHEGYSDAKYLYTLNYAYVPRVYAVYLFFKLVRVRKIEKNYIRLLRKVGYGLIVTKIILTVTRLTIILHLIACLWASSSKMDTGSYINWVVANELVDSGDLIIYITSFYWAVVTALTIGYGDITPTNLYETLYSCCCCIVGVSAFSYALSSLSN